MANGCPMLEISSVSVEEEEDEIELSLGLSIGGSFRKSTASKPETQKSIHFGGKIYPESTNSDADLSMENQCLERSSTTQMPVGDSGPESGSERLDPQKKREFHALRRQEARKKREEKLRKGHGRGIVDIANEGIVNGDLIVGSELVDDKMFLEAQRVQNRARDRERRENEGVRDLNLTLNRNGAGNPGRGSKRAASWLSPAPIPLVPVQYPYSALQYVPTGKGFAYPCVVSCWAATASGDVMMRRMVKMLKSSWRLFGCIREAPARVQSIMEARMVKIGRHRQMDLRCAALLLSPNTGALPLSSKVVVYLDACRSSSSDSGSHSSHREPEKPGLNMASEMSSSTTEHIQANNKAEGCVDKVVPSAFTHCGLSQVTERTTPETQPSPAKNPITSPNPNPSLTKTDSRDLGKPPKLQVQGQNTPSFARMPCVSTTGNGPNGKTITGFLYRYTNTEVSIVCVCHGTSFSPAEFVEHAGGKDISHPLRHITVIPSAFG
ncbi:hypothetical protein NMG60_11034481 [Bertholletia excelsa]